MADQDPNNNLDDFSSIGKSIGNLIAELALARAKSDELNESIGESSPMLKLASEEYTKIKNSLAATKDLAGKLGTEYIKQEQIKRREYENNMNISYTQGIINQLSKEYEEKSDDILALNERALVTRLRLNKLEGEELKIAMQNVDLRVAEYLALENSLFIAQQESGIIKEINNNLEKGNDEFDKSNIKVSSLKRVLSSIANIPIIGPLIDWQRVADKMFESNGNIRKGIAEMGSQFLKLAKEPLVGFLAIAAVVSNLVKSVMEMDKSMTSVSNNLGFTQEITQGIYENFSKSVAEGNKLAESLDNAFLSIGNMAKATMEMQESLETSALFTQEMVQNQILMTKQMGLSAEEAAGFQKFSLLTGKSAESIMQSTIKQNNATISYRKILKEVSTISAELSMRYKNDPEQLAKAVVQANKLGMSLEETRKIASSLLNFEQSIEGELESELLLGRQFNFEKARELALMGKSSEAAGELLGQIGGINELEKMNVIQRERLAAAIGLSADELSKAAINQEVLTKLGFQNRDALEEQYEIYRKSGDQAKLIALQEKARRIEGGEALLQDISRANLNQRFEESINKIKEIFTQIASGPIISILNSMAKLLSHTTALKTLLVLAAASMTAIAISATIASLGAAAAAAAPWIVGIGAAVAGGATAVAVNDSLIEPSGRISISTPEGKILPNKNDSIITTTNPAGLLNGGSDNSAVTAKLDELISEVRKGGNVYIDSTRSGTAYGMSYNSYA